MFSTHAVISLHLEEWGPLSLSIHGLSIAFVFSVKPGQIGENKLGLARELSVPVAPVQIHQEQSISSLFLFEIGSLALLLVAIYGRTIAHLVSDWYVLPDFSHGFLIPIFTFYLIWERRQSLAAVPRRPTWAGAPLFLFGILLLLLGSLGAEIFLSRLSIVVVLAGTVWVLMGAEMLRQLQFPLGVLLLAIPLPAVIFNQITFPLQILASKAASALLPLLGVPVLREGNIIQLPIMQLEVAEACSGIRSLLSLLTIAILYSYFMEKNTARRVLLSLASIPIAVVANSLRIVGTGLCVQYWNPDKAIGFFHEFSGWLMFVLSLLCLYLLHQLIGLWNRRPGASTEDRHAVR